MGANNEVWQLSWAASFAFPLAYQLTAHAGWLPRDALAQYRVHDWLFVYEGRPYPTNPFYDCWLSADYGTTCSPYDAAAKGVDRDNVSGLSVGRRLFVVGGAENSQAGIGSDVWLAYW